MRVTGEHVMADLGHGVVDEYAYHIRRAGWEGLCGREWEKSFEGVEGLGGKVVV
jgi:hypothetical protein